MYNAMVKKRNKKGFTLMEMLIVVAIIAILVAVSVPVFTSQLNNAKEQTDAANVRAAKAVAAATYLTASSPAAYYIYDAETGTLLTTGTDKATGYGKSSGNTDKVIAVEISASGVFDYQWVAATTTVADVAGLSW